MLKNALEAFMTLIIKHRAVAGFILGLSICFLSSAHANPAAPKKPVPQALPIIKYGQGVENHNNADVRGRFQGAKDDLVLLEASSHGGGDPANIKIYRPNGTKLAASKSFQLATQLPETGLYTFTANSEDYFGTTVVLNKLKELNVDEELDREVSINNDSRPEVICGFRGNGRATISFKRLSGKLPFFIDVQSLNLGSMKATDIGTFGGLEFAEGSVTADVTNANLLLIRVKPGEYPTGTKFNGPIRFALKVSLDPSAEKSN